MLSNPPAQKWNWLLKGLWAWVFGIAGIGIIAFVALTEGRYYSWLMWLAIPYLLISFAIALIVYALPSFVDLGENGQSEEQDSDGRRNQ